MLRDDDDSVLTHRPLFKLRTGLPARRHDCQWLVRRQHAAAVIRTGGRRDGFAAHIEHHIRNQPRSRGVARLVVRRFTHGGRLLQNEARKLEQLRFGVSQLVSGDFLLDGFPLRRYCLKGSLRPKGDEAIDVFVERSGYLYGPDTVDARGTRAGGDGVIASGKSRDHQEPEKGASHMESAKKVFTVPGKAGSARQYVLERKGPARGQLP